MHHFFEILKELVNPESIITHGGLYLLLFVVFAETGLFAGFFLPGDSLLFTAGLLCGTGIFTVPIGWLVFLIILAAVLGNITGYLFGKKVGVLLFKRKSSLFFKPNHLVRAKEFSDKHGGLALVLSRFLPVIRTFAPIVAGVIKLNWRLFVLYSLIGAIGWVFFLTLGGYYLARVIPNLKDYLGYIVIFLILITSIPFVVNLVKKGAPGKA